MCTNGFNSFDCLLVDAFPASTLSVHDPFVRAKVSCPKGKDRFSLSTSIVPTLPEYGYTSNDLRFIGGSTTGVDDGFSTEDDWEERTLRASTLTPARKV